MFNKTGKSQKVHRNGSLPKRSDVLIKGIRRTSDGGLLNWGFTDGAERFGPHGRWQVFAYGYILAANTVVEQALAKGGADALVYPAVFLYRQYIEITLKSFLGQIHGEGGNTKPRKANHDLVKLWTSLRGALDEDLHSNLPTESVEATERLIKEIHKHDPDSTSFRYGEDKMGRKRLSRLHSVDLRNLRDVMSRIHNFFDELQQEVDDENEYQMDLDQYRDDTEHGC
jgi:hypothetical protein